MIRIITVLTLLCLLLGAISLSNYKKYRRAKQQSSEVVKVDGKTIAELQYYKNEHCNEVAKNEILLLDNKSIRSLREEDKLKYLSEFNSLKKSYRNLDNYIRLNAVSHSTITAKMVPLNDSTKYFSFDGTFSSGSGTVSNDFITLMDSTTIPLSIVVYWNRKWLLAKKKYYVEATSENKAVKITGIEAIKVIKK